MTDSEHAEGIRKACAELNSRITHANNAGIEVRAEIFPHYCKLVQGDVISVTVRRAI